jgi:hypothetical protein
MSRSSSKKAEASSLQLHPVKPNLKEQVLKNFQLFHHLLQKIRSGLSQKTSKLLSKKLFFLPLIERYDQFWQVFFSDQKLID